MTTILTPKYYLSKPGALGDAGETVASIAKRVYIVGGRAALRVAQAALTAGFDRAGIRYEIFEYSGYPTIHAATDIARRAKEFQAGAVVAVGGGRLTDTVKAAGSIAALPVIAVPTVAATCASWAATSILYNDDGEFTEPRANENAPVFLVLDTDVLAKAPIRYLQSGISDALARWYENAPHLKHSNGFYLRWQLKQAELIREILEFEGLRVVADLKRGVYNPEEVVRVIDAAVFLTGIFVSVRSSDELFYGGIAHNIYHLSTVLHELHGALHGEQIAFALIASALLEGKPEQELYNLISLFYKFEQPLTFEELGLGDDAAERLDKVIPLIHKNAAGYRQHIRDFTPEELKETLLEADELGRAYKAEHVQRHAAN